MSVVQISISRENKNMKHCTALLSQSKYCQILSFGFDIKKSEIRNICTETVVPNSLSLSRWSLSSSFSIFFSSCLLVHWDTQGFIFGLVYHLYCCIVGMVSMSIVHVLCLLNQNIFIFCQVLWYVGTLVTQLLSCCYLEQSSYVLRVGKGSEKPIKNSINSPLHLTAPLRE